MGKENVNDNLTKAMLNITSNIHNIIPNYSIYYPELHSGILKEPMLNITDNISNIIPNYSICYPELYSSISKEIQSAINSIPQSVLGYYESISQITDLFNTNESISNTINQFSETINNFNMRIINYLEAVDISNFYTNIDEIANVLKRYDTLSTYALEDINNYLNRTDIDYSITEEEKEIITKNIDDIFDNKNEVFKNPENLLEKTKNYLTSTPPHIIVIQTLIVVLIFFNSPCAFLIEYLKKLLPKENVDGNNTIINNYYIETLQINTPKKDDD